MTIENKTLRTLDPKRNCRSFLILGVFILFAMASPTAISNATQQDKPELEFRSRLEEIQLPNPNQHERLFQALHAAQILAEIGSGGEAAQIVAAIALRTQPSPPAEEALRRLQQWGLSIEKVEKSPSSEINKIVAANIDQYPSNQPDILHLNNLLDLEAYDEACQFLFHKLTRSPEKNNSVWIEYLNKKNVSVPADLDSVDFLKQATLELANNRQLWRQIQRLWFVDHQSCELALQLWHKQHVGNGQHRHFHHDHDLPWPEVVERTWHHSLQLREDHPQAARTLALLIAKHADEPEWSRRASELVEQIPDSIAAIEPTADAMTLAFQPHEQLTTAKKLFSSPTIKSYRLELDDQSLERLRVHPRDYVPATFIYGGEVLTNVGVRLKGGAGSFRQFDGQAKVGLTVKFNQFDKQQRFHGLRRIVLNNAVQDASYMNEYLGYGLFRQAGLPAPRVTHATVSINDEYYGLYVQPEAVTKDFLKIWFPDKKGNLYEGPGDILNWEHLDLDTNQRRNDRSDLREFVFAIERANDRQPWNDLSEFIDPKSLAKFIAIEQLTGHWDGFNAVNNYRIYHSRNVDKFILIPHGADQLFENPNDSVFHHQASILGRAILQTNHGNRLYIQALDEVLKNHWNEDELRTQIREIYLRLVPVLRNQTGKGHNSIIDFEKKVSRIIEFIELRRSVVTAQMQQKNTDNWRQAQHHVGLPSFLRSR